MHGVLHLSEARHGGLIQLRHKCLNLPVLVTEGVLIEPIRLLALIDRHVLAFFEDRMVSTLAHCGPTLSMAVAGVFGGYTSEMERFLFERLLKRFGALRAVIGPPNLRVVTPDVRRVCAIR